MAPKDLELALSRIPKDLLELLQENAGELFLAGGALRAIITGEQVSDFDLFGPSSGVLQVLAGKLAKEKGGKVFVTENALTVIPNHEKPHVPFVPVQFITRWQFASPEEIANEFDFSIAKAIFAYGEEKTTLDFQEKKVFYTPKHFYGLVDQNFYSDLAAKRLVYTGGGTPGGSMLRMLKMLRRGYSIQVDSLANLLTRLEHEASGICPGVKEQEAHQATFSGYLAKLREVDPRPSIFATAGGVGGV